MNEYDKVPFRATNYEYKVSLGTVTGQDCIGWHSHVYCKAWDDVERLVDAWQDSREHPAVEIDTEYRPIEQ
jgi:hypothetical protein